MFAGIELGVIETMSEGNIEKGSAADETGKTDIEAAGGIGTTIQENPEKENQGAEIGIEIERGTETRTGKEAGVKTERKVKTAKVAEYQIRLTLR